MFYRLWLSQKMHVWSLGQEDPLVKEMATHSSIIAGKINRQRSLADYSLWITESGTIEQLTMHTHYR